MLISPPQRRYQLSALELFEDNDKLRAMKGDSTTNPMQIWSAFLGYKDKSYSSFEVWQATHTHFAYLTHSHAPCRSPPP